MGENKKWYKENGVQIISLIVSIIGFLIVYCTIQKPQSEAEINRELSKLFFSVIQEDNLVKRKAMYKILIKTHKTYISKEYDSIISNLTKSDVMRNSKAITYDDTLKNLFETSALLYQAKVYNWSIAKDEKPLLSAMIVNDSIIYPNNNSFYFLKSNIEDNEILQRKIDSNQIKINNRLEELK